VLTPDDFRLEGQGKYLRQKQIRATISQGTVAFASSIAIGFFIELYRWFPPMLEALLIIKLEAARWHRAGFCRYWGWKSEELRAVILPKPEMQRVATRAPHPMFETRSSWILSRVYAAHVLRNHSWRPET
jgi:hypothetical protein